MSSEILGLSEGASQQTEPFPTVNEIFRQVEGRTVRAISRTNEGPPEEPINGEVFIIDDAVGSWSAYTPGNIAHYYGQAWSEYQPVEGVRLWINDEDQLLVFDGSGWVPAIEYAKRRVPHLVKSASWTVPLADAGVLNVVDASGGNVVATLPAAAEAENREFGFYLGTASGNTFTLQISGPATLFTLAADDEFVWVVSDGSVWRATSLKLAGVGTGDVTGPGSSTDNALPRFDGAGGKTLQASGVIVDDSNRVYGGGVLIKTIAGTTYTVQADDNGKILEATNGSAVTITLPEQSTTSLSAGFAVGVKQAGAGQVSFATEGTDSLENIDDHDALEGQGAFAVITLADDSDPNVYWLDGRTGQ